MLAQYLKSHPCTSYLLLWPCQEMLEVPMLFDNTSYPALEYISGEALLLGHKNFIAINNLSP